MIISKRVWGYGFILLLVTACAGAVEDSTQTAEALLAPWAAIPEPNVGGGSNLPQTSTMAPSLSKWTSQLQLFTYEAGFGHLGIQVKSTGPWVGTFGADFPSISSNLAAVSWSNSRRDIVGVNSTGQLEHVWWDQGWGTWHTLGGTLSNATSGPAQVAITSWESNRLDVFSETPTDATTSALAHRWYEGGWGAWSTRGGSLARRGLTAISVEPHVLDVFAIWTDQQVHRLRYSGGWGNWSTINAPAIGLANGAIGKGNLLTSVTDSSGKIVVLTYGGDNNIYQSVEPFSSWTLVDNSHSTVPGGLTAIRDTSNAAIVLVGWQSIGGALLEATLLE